MDKEEYSDLLKIYDSHSSHILQLSEDVFAYGKYLLPINIISTTVFYYRHFVDRLKHIERLRDKNIIDVGAGIGDSLLILSEYTDKDVHCFEPSTQSFESLSKTIELNSIKNVVCNKFALGSKEDTIALTMEGDFSTCCDKNSSDVNTEEVQVRTLDNYVKENNLHVGLIKVDVEGFEQEFLKGAKETICSQKPTLLLSIYHNAKDFFEIKPLIESWNLGYKFKIVKPYDKSIIIDTTLIAEVD
jgi:FkbM family methyltransferase